MPARTRNVSQTPTESGPAKYFISHAANGDPIIAPPPKPIIAMPAAIPRRSGNHLRSVDTGEMYPSPKPIPPMTPEPSQSSHSWCQYTPMAEITSPPHQQRAETTPAFLGPARSSHVPKIAALDPRNTKKRVYIQPRRGLSQSQVVVTSFSKNPMLVGHCTERVIPIALVRGSQKTENP